MLLLFTNAVNGAKKLINTDYIVTADPNPTTPNYTDLLIDQELQGGAPILVTVAMSLDEVSNYVGNVFDLNKRSIPKFSGENHQGTDPRKK